jgi:hypothetical protein
MGFLTGILHWQFDENLNVCAKSRPLFVITHSPSLYFDVVGDYI